MLKTEYKFIRFTQTVFKGTWNCLNKKASNALGTVRFYKEWKTYTFQPVEDTEFSADCPRDIADFLEQLNNQKSSVNSVVKKEK